MSKGFDTEHNCMSLALKIKQEGFAFVGRYYNEANQSKNLKRNEAIALGNHGIYTVVVWENGFPTSDVYFTKMRGQRDGENSYTRAHSIIQQPKGSCIYFAVDYDCPEKDVVGPIQAYFTAIRQVWDKYRLPEGELPYEVGVYGNGLVCGYLLEKGLVHKTWLSMSTGWEGSETFDKWSIKQYGGSNKLGIDADLDESNGSAGGFLLKTG